ncbi:NEL-type E3 ubiquitin ligase domain-containing protein [Pseudomonas putida]|uniref:NEL-type E3 ubiquitin ligase domain-containing protein n=1 Tax=Pseudomonas putida TaxID=303 RepID=UPI00383B22E1
MTSIPPSTVGKPSVADAVDDFIRTGLPEWLKRASPAQINRLRDRFKSSRASQDKVRAATLDLIPLHTFALEQFTALLGDRLPKDCTLDQLQWLDVRREFGLVPGVHWPFYRPGYVRQPGLLRLMQNFHADDAVLDGSGLVLPSAEAVLSGSASNLARDCREKNVGSLYQAELTRAFSASNCTLLAEDKRSSLSLVIEIAALKGEISALEQIALQDIAQGRPEQHETLLRGYSGMLMVLGCRIIDGLTIALRDAAGVSKGVILYLPSAPQHALRRYDSWQELSAALVTALRDKAYLEFFSGLVALEQRPTFLQTLGKRLADASPDLQIEGRTGQGELFAELVAQQVQRVKSDARYMLVPTADADHAATQSRLQAWQSIGLGLANLAGLFIPAIGAMLFGQLVVQTLSQVFEGAVDWTRGHQHEALEHLLGVAETVAVTAAVAGGAAVVARGFARSSHVDGLEPVDVQGVGMRLWSSALDPYVAEPLQPRLQDDGLYRSADTRWLRVGKRFFAVYQPSARGGWRVRHPLRMTAYGPALEALGERGWRLRLERPLEWSDEARMLQSLWPQEPVLTRTEALAVLDMADIDVEELRGLLVDNRELPANLRETLRRFDADRQVSAFFKALAENQLPVDDVRIEAWCLALPGAHKADSVGLRAALLAQEPVLRRDLFQHLVTENLPADPLCRLLQRDFPGLPARYAVQATAQVSSHLRTIAVVESRVPLEVANDARSLLQLARLNRACESLYLDNVYSDEGAELLLALAARLPGWPQTLRLVLREKALDGRVVKAVGPVADTASQVTLVHKDCQFQRYDHGARRQGEPALSLAQALVDALSVEERTTLGLAGTNAGLLLRTTLRAQLPNTRSERLRLLGWTPSNAWFNPGRRMADGRVGYPLSGRGQPGSSWQPLLDRLRVLYPDLLPAQLEARLSQMQQAPGSLYRRLAELEYDYERLERALTGWLSAGLGGSSHAARVQAAERMRQAWRLQDGQQTLVISGVQLQTLPAFAEPVTFANVTTLVINDTSLNHVPADFLNCFSALTELNLGGNHLLALPRGIAHLVGLRRLRLARNAIRLDEAGVQVLTGLQHLSELDLSHNPLGALILRFNHLPHLREISVRHCRLGAWPDGLEQCGFLERADLRDNQIRVVPAAILQMPNVFRRGFMVEGNPLSSSELRGLYALDTIQEHLHLPERLARQNLDTVRALWLDRGDAALYNARLFQWDTLQAMPNSDRFFQLLGWLTLTQDHAKVPGGLSARVWSLLDAISADTDLRSQLYALADDNLTCLNAVSDRFSDLQRCAAIARADANTLRERGSELIALGQGLFRLDRLDVFARADIRRRVEARDSVDQLAVRLYYRVSLRERLSLPFTSRFMDYASAAEVTDSQLQDALVAVRAAESIEALGESLSQRAFWRRYMLERHAAVFDRVETSHQARLVALQARADQLSAESLALEIEALVGQRDVEELEMIRELTRQMLIGRERGLG